MCLRMTVCRRNPWQVLKARKVLVVSEKEFVVFVVTGHNMML